MFINNNKKFSITTILFSLLLANYNFVAAADNENNATNTNTEVNATITSTTTNTKTNENNAVDSNNDNNANNSTRNPINFLRLGDPTRPPNAVTSQYNSDGSANNNVGQPILQGIFSKHNGAKIAVINSKNYFAGDKVNVSGEDLKISKINENNIVLSGGSAGQIILSLTPNVDKSISISKTNKNTKKFSGYNRNK